MLRICLCLLALVFFAGFVDVYAFEPIPITASSTMDKAIFDGKWSFLYEWKASTLNTYGYNDTRIVLRSAHQDNSIYILLDPITDYNLDVDDHAIICFDSKNNKSTKPDLDDYCFLTYLGENGTAFQGGGALSTRNFFNIIPNPDGFVSISASSDANDRYTPVPHPSYEFKIPTDLVGRESIYGFYFLVYDGHSKTSYTYPQNLDTQNFVASPEQWGEIYSPDKSLPEFKIPILSLFLSILPIVFFQKYRRGVPKI